MPTTRPRHVITETDEIAAAIDATEAAPGETRADRLRRLVLLGAATLHERQLDRAALVRAHAGRQTGAYPEGYLADLRDEWRE